VIVKMVEMLPFKLCTLVLPFCVLVDNMFYVFLGFVERLLHNYYALSGLYWVVLRP